MDNREKKIKKMLREWGKLNDITVSKSEELLILKRFIKISKDGIKEAEKEINRIEENIKNRINGRAYLGEKLRELTAEEQKLVELRYLKRKEWVDITFIMNYSERQLFNIHKRIIEKLCDIV